VFIDEDSRTCDRVACRLEADGYHVLTAADLLQGLELVKVRTPDAVVWSHGVTEDNRCALCDFVRSQLPPQTRPILRCGGSSHGRDRRAKAGYLGVALVHTSSDPGQLATVLDELFPRTDG
jgi:DNA-binding response OmpR family regulator